jgi:hypothetical protein
MTETTKLWTAGRTQQVINVNVTEAPLAWY